LATTASSAIARRGVRPIGAIGQICLNTGMTESSAFALVAWRALECRALHDEESVDDTVMRRRRRTNSHACECACTGTCVCARHTLGQKEQGFGPTSARPQLRPKQGRRVTESGARCAARWATRRRVPGGLRRRARSLTRVRVGAGLARSSFPKDRALAPWVRACARRRRRGHGGDTTPVACTRQGNKEGRTVRNGGSTISITMKMRGP
jgi:hypothetical protein